MINAKERLAYYSRDLKLTVEQGFDEPGKIYDEHCHEKTILYTVAGSLALNIEGEPTITLMPGDEATIQAGQSHSAEVGGKGWKYIAAWDPEEAKKFEH